MLPSCAIKLVLLPVCSMHSPLDRKGKKIFPFAFSFSAVRAARGLAVGPGGGFSPTASEERRLQPFSSRARTTPCVTAVGECPGISPSREPPVCPVEHPEASRLAGPQGGDPVVACSQPDTPALPYPHAAVVCCFFQETFKQ